MSGSSEFFEGFVDDYFAECEEHLTGATRALLALEEAMGDPPAERTAIDELFRLFHTLKGISAMVELKPAEELAHHIEHYLRAIREREVFVSADGIELLIQGTQRLEQIIAARRLGAPQPAIDDVIARVTAAVPAVGAPQPVSQRPPLAGHIGPAFERSALALYVRADARTARRGDRRRQHSQAADRSRNDHSGGSADSA